MPKSPSNVAELRALEGVELGPSDWYQVTQEVVDAFAEATGDRQWIHVDPLRAAASPLGGTIAHGLLTLSLCPKLMNELLSFDGVAHVLNYGYDKVRFPASLRVGTRIRMRATLTGLRVVAGGVQVTVTQIVESEGGEKPVCVAESLARLIVTSTAR